jgi:GNAT superfamily N-acetyltransferase
MTAPLAARIQAYLRNEVTRARDVELVGPFLATFSQGDSNPFRNYAIPDDGARPTAADVAALVAAFERRRRQPRLEYLPAVAPAVEAALMAGGFVPEARMSLMTCVRDWLTDLEALDGMELVVPATDRDLRDLVAAVNEAYGESSTGSGQSAARLHATLAAGGLAVLVRTVEDREPAGGGQCTPPHDGTAEIHSIGVRPCFRGRGVTGAIAGWLARAALSSGIPEPWLMAADASEESVYASAGFRTVSEMLHISRSARR